MAEPVDVWDEQWQDTDVAERPLEHRLAWHPHWEAMTAGSGATVADTVAWDV